MSGGRIRRLAALAAALAAAGSLALAPAHPGSAGPPYETGPQGGDVWNEIHRDPDTGRIAIVRASPIPGVVGCAAVGGYSTFVVRHDATGDETGVEVAYTEALLDPFAWLTVLVVDADGGWYGSTQVRGPLAGDGTYGADFPDGPPPAGTEIQIQFGIQIASACLNADGGTARFTGVTVS